ncbi:MAG: iron uptake transporter permease EfeU [Actinomycetota bacterium]
MGAAFLITLREGIEAALVISIILAYLNTVGRRDRHGTVWAGAGAAVSLSLVAGAVVFTTAGALSEEAEEAFEGIASLLAVGVLTWMIFWMRRQARFIKGELQERVDLALASGSSLALPALAFVVVVREGLETVLFLFGTIREDVTGSVALGYVGAAIGLATAAVLGYLIYRGGVRLNLRTFFRVTGALILVVAAGLLAGGIHELQEIGWLPGEGATAFDISGLLSDETGPGTFLRAMFGYNANPSWLELGAWLSYLAVAGLLFFRPQPAVVARPADPDPREAAARRP